MITRRNAARRRPRIVPTSSLCSQPVSLPLLGGDAATCTERAITSSREPAAADRDSPVTTTARRPGVAADSRLVTLYARLGAGQAVLFPETKGTMP